MSCIPKIVYDARAITERDPAIRGWTAYFEIFFCNAGFQAILVYRLAHLLFRWHIPIIPKLCSYFAKVITGIDIHPGAKIEQGFFIDHGVGTVIGETTIIGKNCTLFQGVTLGGTGKDSGKRHPTLGDEVVVGAGAKVLGNILIGNHTKIGANSVVLRNVPAYCTVVGIPGRIARQAGNAADLEHAELIDPLEELINYLQKDMSKVQKTLKKLRIEVAETERKISEMPIEYHI